MKAWILAGVATAVFPLSAYAERTDHAGDCQIGSTRQQTCIDAAIQPPAPQSAPPPAAQHAEAQVAHPITQRRRSGKRIPDAELIGPRGAL